MRFEGNVGSGLFWPGFKQSCTCSKKDNGEWRCDCGEDVNRAISSENMQKCKTITDEDKQMSCLWHHSYPLYKL